MTLTTKHIYAYMPYNLKCKLGNDILEIDNIKCILCTWLVYFKGSGKTWDYLSSIKLLLKPLSSISDELLNDISAIDGYYGKEAVIEKVRLGLISYINMTILLREGYDVFGLIDNGLAEVKE